MPRTLYQKLRPKRKQQPRPAAPAPEPFTPLPRPASCAVICPACRAEAVWTAAVSSFSGTPDPAELRRSRVHHDPKKREVWHFPALIPASESICSPVDNWTWYRATIAPHSDHRLARHQKRHVQGVRFCPNCRTVEPADIDWPGDAFYAVTIKRTRLFAADRSDFLALRAFLAAPNRRELYRTGAAPWFARYLPTGAIAAKNRAAVLKAMDALISARPRTAVS